MDILISLVEKDVDFVPSSNLVISKLCQVF